MRRAPKPVILLLQPMGMKFRSTETDHEAGPYFTTKEIMKLKEALKKLESLGDEKRKKHNYKHGATDNQFGAKLGDIRAMAKTIKTDHDLALKLWDTENLDARLLAILIMDGKKLSAMQLNKLVRSAVSTHTADWLNSYIVKHHADHESLRGKWMRAKDPMAARAGWNLTAIRVAKNPEGLDLSALLDRIEAEMGSAAPNAQWTMNFVLVEIGIHFPKYRKRALKIGETLGVYREFPTAKGCTSPFAPIWINEMVKRQG